MVKNRFFILILILVFAIIGADAQNRIVLQGNVRDSAGTALELVNVSLFGLPHGTTSNEQGNYKFRTVNENILRLQFSSLGYKKKEIVVKPSDYPGQETIVVNAVLLEEISNLDEIVVKADRAMDLNITRIDPLISKNLPSASGNFEAILKPLPGVSSTNELSSQYSVRGGNFDENMVYVNDIEVYRPLLIRSGQQEGLSFINPDMVSSVLFSAGGFDARYGDKMSSVLDIRYKKPVAFAGSASASLMGGSMHLEGAGPKRRLSHITGIRYKSNKYLLNSLETKGDYNPRFTDLQTYITYDLTPEFEIEFLGNIAHNNYRFVPVDRETSFGTVHEALQLMVYFDGEEEDVFTTYMGSIGGKYRPNDDFEAKIHFSAFQTNEQETFDIHGAYWLNKLDRNLLSDNYADSLVNLGVGSFLEHARNKLKANVYSLSHNGSYRFGNNGLNWGIKYQASFIDDNIQEWIMMDSAGYSLPYSDTEVKLWEHHRASSQIDHQMISAHVQNRCHKELNKGTLTLTAGLRGLYQDINKAYIISPRGMVAFKPDWNTDITFRLSGGAYHQPPFFKEFRDLEGNMNPNIVAQKSAHIVSGTDLYFLAWKRQFKFVVEAYYKYMWDLIPYEVDNVRIRYFGDNSSYGYAAGLDMKVNGEFVPGVDSWASLSIMQTRENIEGDTLGYIPRPTDQRVNVGLFFQDYLPNNRSYKAHLTILFGTGWPFGVPGKINQKTILRVPAYRRVDLGFSKVLITEERASMSKGFLKHFKSAWISLEVFNLLNINNTISHLWITDIRNVQYSIPNYLTGRRINLKLTADF